MNVLIETRVEQRHLLGQVLRLELGDNRIEDLDFALRVERLGRGQSFLPVGIVLVERVLDVLVGDRVAGMQNFGDKVVQRLVQPSVVLEIGPVVLRPLQKHLEHLGLNWTLPLLVVLHVFCGRIFFGQNVKATDEHVEQVHRLHVLAIGQQDDVNVAGLELILIGQTLDKVGGQTGENGRGQNRSFGGLEHHDLLAVLVDIDGAHIGILGCGSEERIRDLRREHFFVDRVDLVAKDDAGLLLLVAHALGHGHVEGRATASRYYCMRATRCWGCGVLDSRAVGRAIRDKG
ncbi:hypothetical protein CAOG_009285 [Capsaspora owczarzaki ATCC 30864]|uniref:Uncharacterized protein n=1 Tax=Capsaspora owczarzaki (strain ATCC 30864) TaxID=595528 RepID=A0A0D2VFK6_CAPO3|nr:hypothetical protein CAOG_009285 [Capsaspora owczarzaki ATCC 30864]